MLPVLSLGANTAHGKHDASAAPSLSVSSRMQNSAM